MKFIDNCCINKSFWNLYYLVGYFNFVNYLRIKFIDKMFINENKMFLIIIICIDFKLVGFGELYCYGFLWLGEGFFMFSG